MRQERELEESRRRFAELSDRQEREIRALRDKLAKKEAKLEAAVELSDIHQEVASFIRFCGNCKTRMTDFMGRLDGIIDGSKTAREALARFFAEIRELIGRYDGEVESRSMKLEELESTRTVASTNEKKLRELEHQLERARTRASRDRKEARNLEKLVDYEHRKLMKLNSTLGISMKTKEITDDGFIDHEIRALKDKYAEIMNPLKSSLTQINVPFVGDEEVVPKITREVEILKSFATTMAEVFEMEKSTPLDSLVDCIEAKLSSIPEIQAENERLSQENDTLGSKCYKMEKLLKKQSKEWKKVHEETVEGLTQQISDLKSKVVLYTPEDPDEYVDIVDESVIENLREDQVRLIKQLIAKKNRWKKNFVKVRSLVEGYQTQVTELEKESSEAKDKLEKLQHAYDAVVEALKEEQGQKEAMDGKLRENSVTINELREENAYQTTQIDAKSKEHEEILTQFASVASDNRSLLKVIEEYKAELSDSKQRLRECQLEKDRIENEKDEKELALAEMERKLATLTDQYEEMSNNFDEFQALHFHLSDKQMKSKSVIADLKKENSKLSHAYSRLQEATCPVSQVEELKDYCAVKDKLLKQRKHKIAEQEGTIMRLSSQVEAFMQMQDKYEQEKADLKALKGEIAQFRTNLKNIHDIIHELFSRQVPISPTMVKILDAIKPIFKDAGLSVFAFDLIRPVHLSTISFREVSIRANPEFELLTPEHRQILNEIQRNLLAFPIDRKNAVAITSLASTKEKLHNILTLTWQLKELFEHQEESKSHLSSLVDSQHTAILQMRTVSETV